jgi:hypothetical protein
MFEIRCLVEDKNLSKIMWALDGLVVGMPQTLPVRGAVAVKSKGQTKVKSDGKGGTIKERVSQAIYDTGMPTITSEVIRRFTVEAGGQPQSAYTTIYQLIKEKTLKRKSKGHFEVLPQPK